MANRKSQPQTFVEMVLALLEDRFPWLGTDQPCLGRGDRRSIERSSRDPTRPRRATAQATKQPHR